jgi:hypothetical protein
LLVEMLSELTALDALVQALSSQLGQIRKLAEIRGSAQPL